MGSKKKLIKNIIKSNLSKEDKSELISLLNNDNSLDSFLMALFRIISISKGTLDAFEIDVGKLLEELFTK